MASIQTITRVKGPSYRRAGSDNGQHEAEWFVELNDYVPGVRALELGQNLASTDRIPRRGEQFRFVSQNETYRDFGSYALDFRVDPYYSDPQDNAKAWKVTVTWRAPKPGNDEQPGTLTMPPLSRPAEFWVEYDDIEQPYADGYVVTPLAVQYAPGPSNWIQYTAGDLAPLRNSSGEGFTVNASRRLPVIVKQYNVATDLVGLQINERFESTVNSTTWRARGLNVKAHYAKFIRAETTQKQYEDNWTFYRVQVRVMIGRKPFYDRRLHTASIHYAAPNYQPEPFRNADGSLAFNGHIGLTRGRAIDDQNQQGNLLEWLLPDPVDYSTLKFD